ncbi:hypothetical protein D027_4703B, partial [Vibrio parahaemolyticus 861]
TTH